MHVHHIRALRLARMSITDTEQAYIPTYVRNAWRGTQSGRSVGSPPTRLEWMVFSTISCVCFFFCKIELVPVKFMYDSSAITTF